MNSFLARNFIYYPLQLLRGENVQRYLRKLNQSQWYSEDELRKAQEKKCIKIINFAYSSIPFYRKLYDRHDIDISKIVTLEDLQCLPTINKKDVQNEINLMVDKKRSFRIAKKTTGGSTGEPVTIFKTAEAMSRARAAMYRGYEWFGVKPGDKQARFWGVPLNSADRVRYQIIDALMNRKRFSAFKFTEKDLENYYLELKKFQPVYFYGYVSMLVQFAEFINAKRFNARKELQLKHIITTSEVLHEWQKMLLKNTFGCTVQNEYGCGEIGPIAYECPKGNMHLNSENVYVETIKNTEIDNAYEIIVTELNNDYMPLIRYNIGDFTTLNKGPCECGRGLSVCGRIFGREYDFIQLSNGHKYHGEQIMYMFECFKRDNIPIAQFQVVQRGIDDFLVKVVPSKDGQKEIILSTVKESFFKELNIDSVEFDFVDQIQREKSGKIRVIKNLLQ